MQNNNLKWKNKKEKKERMADQIKREKRIDIRHKYFPKNIVKINT